jgi:hypothetical protein
VISSPLYRNMALVTRTIAAKSVAHANMTFRASEKGVRRTDGRSAVRRAMSIEMSRGLL